MIPASAIITSVACIAPYIASIDMLSVGGPSGRGIGVNCESLRSPICAVGLNDA